MTGTLPILDWAGRHIAIWSWQIALLFAIARLAVALDLKHRPILRTRIWTLALACFLVLPWAPSLVASFSWSRQVRQALPDTQTLPLLEQAIPLNRDETPATAQATGVRPAPQQTSSLPNVFQILGTIWIAGAGLVFFRKARLYLKLRQVSAVAHLDSLEGLAPGSDWRWVGEPAPRVRLSTSVITPMIYGWFQPLILLPKDIEEWSTLDQRAAMLRHECVHLRRRDHWISWLESIARTAFFFHPLVQSACRHLDIERELSCDDEVLRLGSDADCYAETILKVAERVIKSRALATEGVFFASADLLDRRIDMLFRTRPSMTLNNLVLVPVAGMMAFLFAFGLLQVPVDRILPTGVQFPGFAEFSSTPLPPPLQFLIPDRSPKVTLPVAVAAVAAIAIEPQNAGADSLSDTESMQAVSEGMRLSSEQAAALEKQIEQAPNSLRGRLQLLGFYQVYQNHVDPADAELRLRHVLWLIQNHPNLPQGVMFSARLSLRDPGFTEASQLWLTQVAKQGNVPDVLFNAAEFFVSSDNATAEELYKQGEMLEPNNRRWSRQLANLLWLPNSGDTPEERIARYSRDVEAYERYFDVNGTQQTWDDNLARLIESAYEAAMLDKAEKYAKAGLDSNNANSIHAANWILGEMALHKGDVAHAKAYLLDSVHTKGSPMLNSSGPRMRLAVDLLKLGERNIIVAYFNQCSTFWISGRDKLARWSVLVANGIIPSDINAR